MTRYNVTAIGRWVPRDSGATLEGERDLVLKVLYDYHRAPHNEHDSPMSEGTISHATRLAVTRLRDVCGLLGRDGLVQPMQDRDEVVYWRITPTGVEFVEMAPRNNPFGAF